MMPKVPEHVEIPVSQITIPDSYILTLHRRNTCDVIRLTNLMLPIVVKREGERYILIDGYERLQCAKELGWSKVPALVVEDERTDILRLSLNYVRGRVCGVDVLLYTWQLAQKYDVSILARILGRSYDTVRRYKNAAEALLSLGLSRDEINELHRNCVPIKQLLRCLPDARNRDDLLSCLSYRPRLKTITPETVRIAQKIQKEPEFENAAKLVELVGVDKVEKLLEAWDLLRKTTCTRLRQYRKCLLPEDYNAIGILCDEKAGE